MDLTPVPLCAVCASLGLKRGDFDNSPFFPDDRTERVVIEGTVSSLKATEAKCRLCNLVFGIISQQARSKPDQLHDDARWEAVWYSNDLDALYADDPPKKLLGSALWPRLKDTSVRSNFIQLIEEKGSSKPFRVVQLGSQLDPKVINNWIDRCKREHGEQCGRVYSETANHVPEGLFRCIDVQDMCLKEVETDEEYVALSYVWGSNNYPRTTKDTLQQHSKPGGLDKTTLPTTIADAIDVTKAIGLRYLWVDSLCIVQDDDTGKLALIEAMDVIYGLARLTIVAATGDSAWAGISGWGPHAGKQRHQPSIRLQPDLTVGIAQDLRADFERSAWASRGWTYQEGVLSRRRLIFLDGRVSFCCRAAVWREEYTGEGNFQLIHTADAFSRRDELSPLFDFGQHIAGYTARQLTFPSDIHKAFVGIEKILAPPEKGWPTCLGMPPAAFDYMMMWENASDQHMPRRDDFPSWSWMGQVGRVAMILPLTRKLDQKWLRSRTWIDWYLIAHSKVSVIWDPDRDNVEVQPDDEDTDADSIRVVQHDSDETLEDSMKESNHAAKPRLASYPTYGCPLPENPYGRFQDKMAFLDLYRPQYTKFVPPSISKDFKNYLYFSTLQCAYHIRAAAFAFNPSDPQDVTEKSHTFVLEDNEHQLCGLINLDRLDDISIVNPDFSIQVILLSYASLGSIDAFPIGELAGAGPADGHDDEKIDNIVDSSDGEDNDVDSNAEEYEDGEFVNDTWHTWDHLNILCIRTVRDSPRIVERIGAGIVHKNAIDRSTETPCWNSMFMC